MKKNIIIVSIIAMLGFSGCSGSFEVDGNDGYTTLYLVDEYGHSYSGIPYICDSMRNWSSTAYNGEFSFYPPDNCEFDFRGLNGNYGDRSDDIIRIVDYTDYGKGAIPYNCNSFGSGSTYYDGSFDYNIDDECVFYL